ncbi:unnamed protein product [Clonostachys rosea f. rosea IK726]|uniref:Uncharacterized protein n=1 Tax=Clonostachys rosea f. rosea IK726 TaxID=1349383 RepID=A0ACA9U0K5_BIOOC|nr:unnamed protein product [Clonostachys rosea f. rosea IK726]
MPALWSLQSFLLLITCPRIEQVSMLTSAAGRMALLLGLHKPQNPKLFLFWSCVLASRWDSLRNAESRATSRPCPDLMTFAPSSGPEEATIFTWFFDMVADADGERCGGNFGAQLHGNDWEAHLHQMGAGIITLSPGLKEMMILTRMYLRGEVDEHAVQNIGGLAKQCRASNLNPFASVLQGLGVDK